ncbi:hypothetical protein APY94_01880 [Thermococcus celericrescens]|uniref:Sulfatase N-terminal domain-containing protein n=1 Tax=Thermococcus celericrescens TaxID=227598 RepID=A0A100XZ64_9EURY|nr:sulfatase [Thermococcus celericrescens]KUH34406.1 hypothetical protein APY94_01880 [Thermococcus celericrescens]
MDRKIHSIILITVDSLRSDHLSIYGYNRRTSPFIDKLAKSGILLTQTFANAPYTTASINSMLTSRYPLMGTERYTNTNRGKTLPEVLKENGFYTLGFHSNPWFLIYHFGKGFDIFLDPYSEHHRKQKFTTKVMNFAMKKILGKIKAPYATAEELNEAVLKTLTQLKDYKKLFLWIHYMDVHEPYLPKTWHFTRKKLSYSYVLNLMRKKNESPESLTDSERELILRLYDDKIWELDKELSHLVNDLSDHLDLEKTLIIFTADHGEAFGERGAYGHCANNNLNLHRELLHIPMIFWSENNDTLSKFYHIEQSNRISKIFSLMDLGPTILNLLGIKIPSSFLGRDLINDKIQYVISQGVVAPDPNIEKYVKTNERAHAITNVEHKLIWWEQREYTELYNLVADPLEQQNIANENLELVHSLKSIIKREISQYSKPEEDEKLKKAIKNLKLKGKI